MQLLWIVLVAALCAAVTTVTAQCDCRTAASCPQAYQNGQASGCYLAGGRTVGVCCPPSSPATSYQLRVLPGGIFGNGGQSSAGVRNHGQRARGWGSAGQGGGFRNTGHGGSFKNTGHGSSFGGTGHNGGFKNSGHGTGFGNTGHGSSLGNAGQSGRLRNTGQSGNIRNAGQGGGFGSPGQSGTRPSTAYGAPLRGGCRPLVLCPPLVASPDSLSFNGCSLPDGSPGVICTFAGPQLAAAGGAQGRFRSGGGGLQGRSGASGGQSALDALRPMATVSSANSVISLQVSADAVQQAQAVARQSSSAFSFTANQLVQTGQVASANSPTGLFFLNSQSSDFEQQLGLQALQALETISALASTTAVPPSTVSGGIGTAFGGAAPASQASQGGIQMTTVPTCQPEPTISCPNSIYRSVTGECNNLLQPRLGRSLTGMKRLLPNTFDDGVFSVRTRAERGGTLPSARLVSERVLDTFSNELRHHTLSLMQLSQFVDHDFAHALVFRLPSGAGIQCCLDEGQTFPPSLRHPQCIPIPIPTNDPFYSQFGQRCMSLVRSLPAPEPDCTIRPAKPLNELTSFLDASNVYGSSEEETGELRARRDGLLRESGGRLLPLDGSTTSDRPCVRSTCFRAGDTRVNEQSLLAVIHTVWMREHNRIAAALKSLHPGWGDEQLFQEARRVLIAEWQHILYNEWLPVVVGFEYADAHGLLPLQSGFSGYYDPSIDPTISNVFSTAAFRFGHTMVRDMYDLLDANGGITGSFNLTTTFFDPTVISNGVTEHARTMIAQRSETFDTGFAHGLHEQLFTTNFVFGLDLLALNVQRGRDHGTPTYAQVAEACGIVTVRSWGDLNRVMNSDAIDRLRFVYDDPRDVDLFIGGVAERRANGAQVGPTFQCVIGRQFFDLRFGDRFFYDNGGFPHSFSLPQLGEIRKSNWARILCDTLGPEFGNDFTQVQPLAILTELGQNRISSCNSLAIPRVDLSVF